MLLEFSKIELYGKPSLQITQCMFFLVVRCNSVLYTRCYAYYNVHEATSALHATHLLLLRLPPAINMNATKL